MHFIESNRIKNKENDRASTLLDFFEHKKSPAIGFEMLGLISKKMINVSN